MGNFYLNETRENALIAWIESVLTEIVVDDTDPDNVVSRIVWESQDAFSGTDNIKRPATPYVSLKLLSGPNQLGEPSRSFNVDTSFNYSIEYAITLEINIFANDQHLLLAERLRSSLNLPASQLILTTAGWGIHNASSINDLSTLVSAHNELRATFDLPLTYATTQVDDSGLIEDINITGEHQNPAGTIIETNTINVQTP